MKTLILTLLMAFLFAAPAGAKQPKVLLIGTPINVTLGSINDIGECFPFGTEYYVTTYCYNQWGAWHVQRDATITEIQVIVIVPTEDMSGHCALQIYTESVVDTFDVSYADPIYFNVGPGTSPGYQNRKAVDIDVTRGQALGFAIEHWTGIPSQCHTESQDPTFQLWVWGYYTD